MSGSQTPAGRTFEAMLEQNLVASFRASRGRPWAEVVDEPDVTWNISGVPWSWCNAIAGARFTDENADERIDTVLSRYRAQRLRTSWWMLSTSTPADLANRLAAHALEVGEPEPGMVCELDAWTAPRPADGIAVERVESVAAFSEWCAVFVEGMEMDPPGAAAYEQRYVDISVGADAEYRTYVARRKGRAISSAWGVMAGDVVGVYGVATLTDARRQGAGTAVTARVMEDARCDGARFAVLFSSHEGLGVYQRLGFRTACQLLVATRDFGE